MVRTRISENYPAGSLEIHAPQLYGLARAPARERAISFARAKDCSRTPRNSGIQLGYAAQLDGWDSRGRGDRGLTG